MNAADKGIHRWRHSVLDYTPFPDLRKGLRRSWGTPPRAGIYRLIAPWAYRHLRFYGVGHTSGGAVAAAAGAICVSYGVYGWAAFFLALGAINLAGGCWLLAVDRSASART